MCPVNEVDHYERIIFGCCFYDITTTLAISDDNVINCPFCQKDVNLLEVLLGKTFIFPVEGNEDDRITPENFPKIFFGITGKINDQIAKEAIEKIMNSQACQHCQD